MSGVTTENSRKRPSTALLAHSADADILDFRVIEDAVLGAFAAGAGFLDSAEGRHLRGNDPGIQTDDSVFDRLRDAPAASEVARIYIGSQTELGVVRHGDSLRFGFELEERSHRPESLFARQQHFRSYVGEDCGLEEGAAEGV